MENDDAEFGSNDAHRARGAPRLSGPGGAALRRLTVTELKLFGRERGGVIWGVGFPLLLLVIFGNIPGFRTPVARASTA